LNRRTRLDNLRLELAQLLRQMAAKQKQEQQLRSQIAMYQSRVEAAPMRDSEMIELTRDYNTLQEFYTDLLGKREDSKIAANLERRQIGEQFKLLDPARVPERPFSPNRQVLNMTGMGGGLALGVMLIALLEYRDKSFKTDMEVMQVLSLPVLAVVPHMQSPSERKWAFRRRLALNVACGTAVTVCLAVVVYTFIR
jgi:uncharacterized protein involved in exopolysaccharide biosynthesis